MLPSHQISAADYALLNEFASGELPPARFHHREHVRLAYIFLVIHGSDVAASRLRQALQAYLGHHGIDPAKYHETMTQAWMLAVHHFMQMSPAQTSSEAFISAQPVLLDPKVMLTHYSSATIKSDAARSSFVEPDLDPIPRHSLG
jgi:hypothetical protein